MFSTYFSFFIAFLYSISPSMSNSTNIVVGLACIFIDLGVLTLTALALGGGTWIEEVREQGDFFTRAQNSYHDMAMFSNNMDLTGIGMWRYFTQPGVSFPLPFRGTQKLSRPQSVVIGPV